VNDALTLNQSSLQREKDEAAEGSSSSAREKDERIRDLEEQVRDLMVFLDAREKVAAEAVVAGGGNGSEEGPSESIRGGSVLGVAGPAVPGADDAPSRSGTHARLQKKLAARQNKRGG
jgi:BRCA1-associated protein